MTNTALSRRTQRVIDLAYAVSEETQAPALMRFLSEYDTIGVLVHSYASHSVIVYGTPHALHFAGLALEKHGYHVSPAHLVKSDRRRIGQRNVVAIRVVRPSLTGRA